MTFCIHDIISIMVFIVTQKTLSIKTLGISIMCCYAECHYAECHVSFIVILNVIMLSIVMLNVMPGVKVPNIQSNFVNLLMNNFGFGSFMDFELFKFKFVFEKSLKFNTALA
jgi:hypothetical protein